MIRILAISDTHLEVLTQDIAALARGADIVAHCGDFVTEEVYDDLSKLGRLEAVCGNSDSPDLKRLLPERRTFEAGGVRIGMVHRASHSSDPTGASMLAREMDVDILIFGHIHRPYIERGKRIIICPGSPVAPRMSPPTVAEIEIEDGQVNGRIVPIGKPICDYLKFAQSLAEDDRKTD
jgi:uncharacterized protein